MIQIALDAATPWILFWLGGTALDMIFGGRKAFGLIPSLDSLSRRSVIFLRARLERPDRSKRTHHWRGILACTVLVTGFAFAGFAIDHLLFHHATLTALGAFVLAKLLGLKIAWQQINDLAVADDFRSRRVAVRQAVDTFAGYFVPGLLLFLAGGFTLLLPFHCLHTANRLSRTEEAPSAFMQPFTASRNLVSLIGEILGMALLAAAVLFWPDANWKRALKAAARPKRPIRNWPLNLVTHAFNLSLEKTGRVNVHEADQSAWIGPADARARLTSQDCKNALIVALIAFGLTLAFLLLLLLAGAMG